MKGKYISMKKLEELGIKVRKCVVCEGILPKHKGKYCGKECWKEARKEINKKWQEEEGRVKENKVNCKEVTTERELLIEIRDLLNNISIELRKEG